MDISHEYLEMAHLDPPKFGDSINFWMNGVLSLVLVIIGMIGNTAVVVSFHCCGVRLRQRRRQAFYYYLMTFAVWNTGLLIATVLFNCIPTLMTGTPSASRDPHGAMRAADVLYLIGYLGGNCCVTANVWLAVTLTIERYLAVSRPLQSRLTSPRRRAKLICILLSLLVVVYNLPLMFELSFTSNEITYTVEDEALGIESEIENSTVSIFDSDRENRSVYKLHLSPMRANIYYQMLYRVVFHFIFVSFVPFSIILLLTIKIVCVVRESDRKRAQFRKPTVSNDNRSGPSGSGGVIVAPGVSKSRHADIVLTLIAAKFLLFYSLPVVINIVELTVDNRTFASDESEASKILRFLVDLSNLLVVVDGATNSFFYFSWRNRIKAYRLMGRSKFNTYGWMNLESRCTQGLNGEYGLGIVSEAMPRKRSRLEWSPSLRLDSSRPSPSTVNDQIPFQSMSSERTPRSVRYVGSE